MLQHDAPSMFSRVFLSNSGFIESASRRITITDKSPELFTFILDYLRGYNIFPLNEAAIPPRWLPLHKTCDNLRRDASYYGLLRLEAECSKWLKRILYPSEKQAVLRLDFAPFQPDRGNIHNPLTPEMILDCHLADVHLLRKRFLKCGTHTLTYGPIPWKQIFEQIRGAADGDGVIQLDGSALVEIGSVFLKPPRAEETEDERKIDWAKIHVSKEVTKFIQNGIRQNAVSNNITLRFHATDVTCILKFVTQVPPEFSFDVGPFVGRHSFVGYGQLFFCEKIQKEGWMALRAFAQGEGSLCRDPNSILIPLQDSDKTVLEVDEHKLDWATMCEWKRDSEILHFSLGLGESVLKQMRADIALCERLFGKARKVDMGSPPDWNSIVSGLMLFV